MLVKSTPKVNPTKVFFHKTDIFAIKHDHFTVITSFSKIKNEKTYKNKLENKVW